MKMTSLVTQVVKLSHKQFRAMLKKFRRKKKRQQLAKAKEAEELLEQQRKENSPGYKEREEDRRRNAALYEEFEERERMRAHKLWLLREQRAQKEFRIKKERLEQEKIHEEEERKRILAEYEEKLSRQATEDEEKRKVKSQKEEVLQKALSELPEASDGPWHNPIAPENYLPLKEKDQCQFFAKTACCRFGERCSKGHVHPDISNTLLIRGMFSHFSIGQEGRDDYDTDVALEFDEGETYIDFLSFYSDVLPEFKKYGKVMQFKVCSNHEVHLRGNVYVQYRREEQAVEAFRNMNGRFYGGKQITCEFVNVPKWKSAICGMFERKLCPKGINCNFLHVFKNPRNEFSDADRDFQPRNRHERPHHFIREHFHSRRSERHYDEYANDSSRDHRYHHYSRSHSRHDDHYPYSDEEWNSKYKSYGSRKLSPHGSSDEHYHSGDEHNSKNRKNKSKKHRHKSPDKDHRYNSSGSSDDFSRENSSKKHKHSKKRKQKKKKRSSSRSDDD